MIGRGDVAERKEEMLQPFCSYSDRMKVGKVRGKKGKYYYMCQLKLRDVE